MCPGTGHAAPGACLTRRKWLPFIPPLTAIALTLPLAVARRGFGPGAPIGLLIIGMFLPPLLPAVLDHLRIDRVGLNLPPMVIGPAMALALRLAADALLESIRGWMKASLAVGTAAGLGQRVSSEIERDSSF